MPSQSKLVAFQRLHALAKRGYRPRLGSRNTTGSDEAIELSHPRSNAKPPVPNVILHPNGDVWLSARKEIEYEYPEEFARFARSVKLPTFHDLYVSPAIALIGAILLATLISWLFLIPLALLVAFAFDDWRWIWPAIWYPLLMWTITTVATRERD